MSLLLVTSVMLLYCLIMSGGVGAAIYICPRLWLRHTARRRAIRKANTRADNMRAMRLNCGHSFWYIYQPFIATCVLLYNNKGHI